MTVPEQELRAEMDMSAWDANKAMGACSSAADYRSICAGEVSAGEPDQRQHWKLPHHYLGQPANAAGVRAARGRFSQTEGLTNREKARTHLFETHRLPSDEASSAGITFPRENISRAMVPGMEYEIREAGDGDGSGPTLFGHFAVFDQWEEIDSLFEGHFMERIAPGSFEKSFRENRDRIKPTFNHGHDPDMGDKVLGPIRDLSEDEYGAAYEVPLFPSVPPLIVEGLREGVYGSSFRFRVTREEVEEEPGVSNHNPKGLPERTIKEVQLFEFGPVTFPAYVGATAGVRSMTDDEVVRKLITDPPRLARLIEAARDEETQPVEDPPSTETPAPATSPESAGHTPQPVESAARRFRTREEYESWLSKS